MKKMLLRSLALSSAFIVMGSFGFAKAVPTSNQQSAVEKSPACPIKNRKQFEALINEPSNDVFQENVNPLTKTMCVAPNERIRNLITETLSSQNAQQVRRSFWLSYFLGFYTDPEITSFAKTFALKEDFDFEESRSIAIEHLRIADYRYSDSEIEAFVVLWKSGELSELSKIAILEVFFNQGEGLQDEGIVDIVLADALSKSPAHASASVEGLQLILDEWASKRLTLVQVEKYLTKINLIVSWLKASPSVFSTYLSQKVQDTQTLLRIQKALLKQARYPGPVTIKLPPVTDLRARDCGEQEIASAIDGTIQKNSGYFAASQFLRMCKQSRMVVQKFVSQLARRDAKLAHVIELAQHLRNDPSYGNYDFNKHFFKSLVRIALDVSVPTEVRLTAAKMLDLTSNGSVENREKVLQVAHSLRALPNGAQKIADDLEISAKLLHLSFADREVKDFLESDTIDKDFANAAIAWAKTTTTRALASKLTGSELSQALGTLNTHKEQLCLKFDFVCGNLSKTLLALELTIEVQSRDN